MFELVRVLVSACLSKCVFELLCVLPFCDCVFVLLVFVLLCYCVFCVLCLCYFMFVFLSVSTSLRNIIVP